MAKHARLSASSAHRWALCPGSVRLSEGLPNRGSASAAEGTLAHEIAAERLTPGHSGGLSYLGSKMRRDGHEVTCDQEMIDGVQLYIDHVAATQRLGDQEFVEVDLTPALAKIHPGLGGTADFVRYRPSAGRLDVMDFKYGAGTLVNPDGNKQLLLYALGALLTLDKPGVAEVAVTIVQPRIEHEDGRIRSWSFPAVDLLLFAADVEESAARTQDPNAPLVPGESQCKWCPARHECPALEAKSHALTALEFGELRTYDPAKLAQALADAPLVESRIKALREFAYAEAERGSPPPGWKLVLKRGTRKWVADEAVRTWAEQRAIDPFEDPKMKSPAQLEKGLTKEQKAELGEMTVTISSGHTLAPDSDKRPAVHKALATEFAVIPGTAE